MGAAVIFGERLLPLVLDERKQMTRRRVKSDEQLCRYRPGRDYAVQPGRGQSAVARIHIDSVRRQVLREITEGDARLEGFARRRQFLAYWEELYGEIDLYQQVWALRFTLLAPCRGVCGETTLLRSMTEAGPVPLCGKVDCASAAL